MQQDTTEAPSDIESTSETLPVLKQLRLGLSRNYYAMANAFGLKRLQDYFQVPFIHQSMFKRGHLSYSQENAMYCWDI